MPALSHPHPGGVHREIEVSALSPDGRRPTLLDVALVGDSLHTSPVVDAEGRIHMRIRIPAGLGSPWAEKVATAAARYALGAAGLVGWDVAVDLVVA